MKKLIKKILDFVFNAKNEKFILIVLPCLTILIAAVILIPIFKVFLNESLTAKEIKESSVSAVSSTELPPSTPSATVLPAAQTPGEDNSGKEEIKVHLTATSTEKDLYIFIRDENNIPVSGQVFKLSVTYPGGQVGTYDSSTDGSCYLVKLSPGNYTVSLNKCEGYTQADSIDCYVNETISYTYIENIEDIVDVADVSTVINEVKVNESEAPSEQVAEVISTASSSGIVPVYDSNGNPTYTYSWLEDESGHILDSDGNPTDVFPYFEEEGKLLWGFKLDGTSTQEEVKLINDDNSPVDGYSITATPVIKEANSGWYNEGGKVYYLLDNNEKAVGLKSIDGQICYFDYSGAKCSSVGIDVSFYNGTVNWSTVKNSGIDFVIVRLGGRGWGTGALYDDSCFYNYINGAKAAGLKVGVYFYSAATNRVEAVQEASVALDRLSGIALDFPVYIDIEYSGDYPNGRADNLSRAERVEICTAFCETIENAGYKSGIYSSESFLTEGLDYSSISKYNIWMASYTENDKLPSTAYRYDIWQISDRGRVPGINGNCDINIIR